MASGEHCRDVGRGRQVTEASTRIVLSEPRAAALSVAFARLAAVLVCVIGEIVLAMWLRIIPGLEGALPSVVGMTPNAALGVIVAGLGLLCFTFRRLRFLARLIGFLLVGVGLIVFGQHILGVDLGLGQLLLPVETVAPGLEAPELVGRAAPGVTGSLVLFGLALIYAKRGKALAAFSQIVALFMLAQVLIVLAGYAYGVATNYYPFPFTAMSVYGALSAFLLATGLLAASPEYGVAAAIVERSPAGEMLRRLLPGILVLPLVIGWFARHAEQQTLYDSAATLAIFAVASIIVLAVFAWTTIGAVRRADQDRNEALMELRGQREWLSTTLGSIGDGVIATDPNGSVLLLNKVAQELTGWSAAEARGRPIWEVFRVIDEVTRKPVDDPALKALREREVTRLESGALLITRDDREVPVEHSGAPIIGSDGSLAGAVLVFRDVTERRKTAQRQTMLVGELNHRVKNFCSSPNGPARASRPWSSASSILTDARTGRRS
jgi:PAS domain S-box-containing protein